MRLNSGARCALAMLCVWMQQVANGTDNLDDLAASVLWRFRNEPVEHLGLLYSGPNGPAALPPQSIGNSGKAKGRFTLPGQLLALYHNHPPKQGRDTEHARFSEDDLSQAKRLGVPSYIIAGTELVRYTPGGPSRGAPVLAQFPIDAVREYLMQTLLGRSADDPRGLLRDPVDLGLLSGASAPTDMELLTP
jgi:hypothetical protein